MSNPQWLELSMSKTIFHGPFSFDITQDVLMFTHTLLFLVQMNELTIPERDVS